MYALMFEKTITRFAPRFGNVKKLSGETRVRRRES